MPGAALHLTHLELLSREPGLHPALHRALQQQPISARLGAVLLDLPYYTGIVPLTLGYWLEWPARECPLARAIHTQDPDLLAWQLLRRAFGDRRLPHDQRLALVAGCMAHMALDMELHPLVNFCAERDLARFGGEQSHHHRLTEKYHSLYFHRDRQGLDPIGTWGFFARKTLVMKRPPFVRLRAGQPLFGLVSELLAGLYPGHHPGPRQVARWVRNFRHFALMVCMPWAHRNSLNKGTPENRRRYYENDQFCFLDYWQRAYARSVALLNLAHEVWAAGDFGAASREDFLRQAQICDLARGRQHVRRIQNPRAGHGQGHESGKRV